MLRSLLHSHRVFTLELLHSFISVGLIDPAFAATIDPTVFNDYHPRLLSEAQEIGMDLTVSFFLTYRNNPVYTPVVLP